MSTPRLVWLAFMLPLLALLGSQLGLHCDEQGSCSAPERIVALLTVPFVLGWLGILGVLVWRAVRRHR